MALKSKQVGDILILYPSGILSGGKETDELQARVDVAEAAGNRKLIFNMSDVTHMNTPAITVLVAALKHYRQRGARIALCCLDKHLHAVFVIVKLVLIFDVYQTEEEAIASFSEEPARA